ncbi:MAG: RCC1 repeat-containing protein, partial [Acidobacteria bacterium]|nr:RCC1 repeat-containing protein [Acidobacteriota bacterium]
MAIFPASAGAAVDVAAQLNAGVGASTSFTGGGHTCIVTKAGGVKCWGDNSAGQLGDDTFEQRTSPVTVVGVSNAVEVASGGDHSCARVTNGDVYCWGDNSFGQIGSDPDSVANSATAVKVAGVSGAIGITAGAQHSCALLTDKTVSCWGNGLWGALGVGDANGNSSFTPLAVTGLTNVTAIVAGATHTCALRESGGVSCWGGNDSGQLGIGTLDWMAQPTSISGLTGVSQLSAGPTSTCATLDDKSVKCWGDNTFGQIGDGTDSPRLAPKAVSGLTGATSVTVGDGFACARLEGGSVKCWGVTDPRNQWCEVISGSLTNCFSIIEYGDRSLDPTIELAVNPAAVSYTPKTITGISDAAQLSAGDRHLCVLRANSAVTCQGLNAYGQLGDKTTTAAGGPVSVSGLGYTSPPPTVTGGAPAAFT